MPNTLMLINTVSYSFTSSGGGTSTTVICHQIQLSAAPSSSFHVFAKELDTSHTEGCVGNKWDAAL